ncbi:SPOR domain-containing protein [Massilia sp. SR12]
MGLLSKFGKDKQDAAGEDSGYYRAQDDRSLSDKARSKRATNAGAGADAAPRRSGRKDAADPVLPEKKRARRRLVGAIALALGVAIGLPMLLDSEPKSSVADIAINMPSKDKPGEPLNGGPASAPAPVPAPTVAQPATAATAPAAPAANPAPAATPAARTVAPVATGAALDKGEEIVHVPAKPALTEPAKPPKAAEPKVAKPEPKHTEPKPEPKKEAKPEAKPAHADDARAMAILEGKPADAAPATKYVIKVGAFAAKDKVDELQRKLGEAGIKSYAQKVSTANGELTSVRVGPFPNKEEAEKVKAKLGKLGLNGSLTPA